MVVAVNSREQQEGSKASLDDSVAIPVLSALVPGLASSKETLVGLADQWERRAGSKAKSGGFAVTAIRSVAVPELENSMENPEGAVN